MAYLAIDLWKVYREQRDAYQAYQVRIHREQDVAAAEIASQCGYATAPSDLIVLCLAEELKAYQKRDNTDKDLQAQQDMARWALWLMLISALGLPISVVGLYAVVTSLRHTKEAISIDREVGHAEVRAYMGVKPEGYLRNEKRTELKLTNSGQSPAHYVSHIAATSKLKWPLERSPRLLRPADSQITPTRMFGPRGESHISAEWVDREDELKGDHVCVYGIIYYKDIFGKRYQHRFLARLVATEVFSDAGVRGERQDWELAPFHNDEQEIES